MEWLGLERHKPVDREAIRRVAWALNVDADALAQRIVTLDSGRQGWVRLAGQRVRRHIASTRYYAKLCPQCVRERGITRVSWLLRATVGCPLHGYSLIRSCKRCGQGISWDRPDVDICHCGHPFKAMDGPKPLEARVQAWLCWLESAVCQFGQPATNPVARAELPDALTHLSIDGAFRIIEAAGLCVSCENVRVAIATCKTPHGLGAVIERGIERIQSIQDNPEAVQRYARVFNQVALVQLVGDYAAPADHSLAWWLLQGFGSVIDPGTTKAGKRPKGQLPLFLT